MSDTKWPGNLASIISKLTPGMSERPADNPEVGDRMRLVVVTPYRSLTGTVPVTPAEKTALESIRLQHLYVTENGTRFTPMSIGEAQREQIRGTPSPGTYHMHIVLKIES